MSINHSQSFDAVLKSYKSFQVPAFQRNYTWSAENWLELKRDIFTLLSHDTHYLGALILLNRSDYSSGDIDVEIVDGQQRIVTLLILVAACRNALIELHDNSDAYSHCTIDSSVRGRIKRAEKYANDFFIQGFEEESPENRRVFLNEKDDPIFVDKVFNNKKFSQSFQRNSPRVHKCLAFFSEILEKEILCKPTAVEDLQNILKTVGTRALFTLVEVTSDAEAFDVFESLNSKGEQLTAADLLKNRFVMSCGDDMDAREETLQSWNQLLGLLSDSRFDIVDFMYFYWMAFEDSNITLKKLYRSIRNALLDGRYTSDDLLGNLTQAATEFARWTSTSLTYPPRNTDSLESMIAEINTLRYRACYPIFLLAHRKCPDSLLEIVDVTLSYLFRTITISRGRVQDVESTFKKVNEAIRAELDHETLMSKIREAIRLVQADDDLFKLALQQDQIKDARVARYILAKIYYANSSGELDISQGVHLEHVLPQKPAQHWGDFTFKDAQQQDVTLVSNKVAWERGVGKYIYNIGNMALLQKVRNSQIGNKPIEVKLPALSAWSEQNMTGSELPLTAEIGEMVALNGGLWTAETIEKRKENLIDRVTEFWKAV